MDTSMYTQKACGWAVSAMPSLCYAEGFSASQKFSDLTLHLGMDGIFLILKFCKSPHKREKVLKCYRQSWNDILRMEKVPAYEKNLTVELMLIKHLSVSSAVELKQSYMALARGTLQPRITPQHWCTYTASAPFH
jgi:hypothetical protein